MNLFQHEFKDTPVTLDLQRSRFDMSHSLKTTFNQGDLVPIFLSEVLPGDTFSLDMSAFVRMTTPVFPVMDNANLDVYFFFVPSRILWDHFKEFHGENNTAPWQQQTEYTIPQMYINGRNVSRLSLAAYLGVPANLAAGGMTFKVNALPFRAYYSIWSNWFRDENLQYPLNIYKGDSDVQFRSAMTNGFEFGHTLLPVQRYADYFSTALPQPQKGPAVQLPLGASAPVRTSDSLIPLDSRYQGSLQFSASDGRDFPAGNTLFAVARSSSDTKIAGSGYLYESNPQTGNVLGVVPRNLFADLSEATASTVNELRQAFAVQRLFERDAIGGTRFREMLKAHFGVTIPDSTVQIPEYLGGFRQPINIEQVVQTSSTDQTSPLATPSAVSVTTHVSNGTFTKSFVEPGYILGLAAVRVQHSYSQGLDPLWFRERRFDFYYPALANIGNQPIYKKELFASASNMSDNSVFGYKEAWAEYRYMNNRATGLFKSAVTGATPQSALQSWIYADFYSSSPALSDQWIREGKTNVQNTLAVQDEDQFLADFYFKVDAYRPMPLYSVPGLIDHH